jgi:hypothetical protein
MVPPLLPRRGAPPSGSSSLSATSDRPRGLHHVERSGSLAPGLRWRPPQERSRSSYRDADQSVEAREARPLWELRACVRDALGRGAPGQWGNCTSPRSAHPAPELWTTASNGYPPTGASPPSTALPSPDREPRSGERHGQPEWRCSDARGHCPPASRRRASAAARAAQDLTDLRDRSSTHPGSRSSLVQELDRLLLARDTGS